LDLLGFLRYLANQERALPAHHIGWSLLMIIGYFLGRALRTEMLVMMNIWDN